jgi:methylmalonyl-CoA/ethylmalonyl-CoA epimerase
MALRINDYSPATDAPSTADIERNLGATGMHKIHHLAIVVEDVQAALSFWRDALGLSVGKVERNEREEVDVAFLPLEAGEIELISPINETSGVARFLTRHGAGFHHVCIQVDDIEATMRRLREHKVMLLNDVPKVNEEGTRYCFIHPKSTSGALVELYEPKK